MTLVNKLKMSYLLTEISLEMMGYRFYDLDGVPREINYKSAESPLLADSSEKHLMEILDLSEFIGDSSRQRNNAGLKESVGTELHNQGRWETVSLELKLECENVRLSLSNVKEAYCKTTDFKDKCKDKPANEVLQCHLNKCLHRELDVLTALRQRVENEILKSLPGDTFCLYTRLCNMLNTDLTVPLKGN